MLLFFLLFGLSLQNAEKVTQRIVVNFKSKLMYSSIVFPIARKKKDIEVSIDIMADKNIIYLPPENIDSNESEMLPVTENFKTTELISFYTKNLVTFRANKVLYGFTLPLNIVPSHTMDNEEAVHFPMSNLALGRRFKNNETSFVEGLYKYKHITQRKFTVIYSFPLWGTISFGEEDETISSMSHLKEECHAVDPVDDMFWSSWGCQLTGMFIGNDLERTRDKDTKVYNIDPVQMKAVRVVAQVYFSTVEKGIIVPCQILDYLKDNFFNKFLEEGTCRVEKEKDKKYFRCRHSISEELSIIHFVFEERLDLFIHGKRIFDGDGRSMIYCYEKNERNAFIFGYYFLKNWSIIFDHEKDEIGFFSLLGKIRVNPIGYRKEIVIKQGGRGKGKEIIIDPSGNLAMSRVIKINLLLCSLGVIFNIFSYFLK